MYPPHIHQADDDLAIWLDTASAMADDSDLDRPLVVNDAGVSKQSPDSFAITAALIAALGA